jgi:hypothetical protein
MPVCKPSPRFRHHSDRSDFSLMLFGGTITRRESPNVTSDLALGGSSSEGNSKTEGAFEVNLREGHLSFKHSRSPHKPD